MFFYRLSLQSHMSNAFTYMFQMSLSSLPLPHLPAMCLPGNGFGDHCPSSQAMWLIAQSKRLFVLTVQNKHNHSLPFSFVSFLPIYLSPFPQPFPPIAHWQEHLTTSKFLV
ncbi:hypothetical protein OTU49_008526 [Cherax quadricarinatus]|uniref:Uncharacterized protein n=1 Tax=Cherax quadricarinatus TaxID=27406 RepID=A0AAW0WPX6_CHEQU